MITLKKHFPSTTMIKRPVRGAHSKRIPQFRFSSSSESLEILIIEFTSVMRYTWHTSIHRSVPIDPRANCITAEYKLFAVSHKHNDRCGASPQIAPWESIVQLTQSCRMSTDDEIRHNFGNGHADGMGDHDSNEAGIAVLWCCRRWCWICSFFLLKLMFFFKNVKI